MCNIEVVNSFMPEKSLVFLVTFCSTKMLSNLYLNKFSAIELMADHGSLQLIESMTARS